MAGKPIRLLADGGNRGEQLLSRGESPSLFHGRRSAAAPSKDSSSNADLDPKDWDQFSELSHSALEGMLDHLRTIRNRPVWIPAPSEVRARFASGIPKGRRSFDEVLREFEEFVKPYATGNLHPAFMGWVHGAGTPVGMVAEMLAAGLNANCGGRDHIGVVVEKQIGRWMQESFGFPDGASGLFVTGTSMANFLGLLVARNHALGNDVRKKGVAAGPQLCAYASKAAHGCIAQAMALSGIGSDHLRLVPCDEEGAMRVPALQALIAEDNRKGLKPFLVVGTAGTVDIGAIDPMDEIADLAAAEHLWFHVDGAFGALATFSPELRPLLAGIERADSIGFDFHKWLHVPYDAGFLLVRDGEAHRNTFANTNLYLTRAAAGLAAGDIWPCDLGPDLSRGFRALKVWFTLQVFGADQLGRCMLENCRAAKHLGSRLRNSAKFQLKAPVKLNIVCFSLNSKDPDRDNRRMVEALHLSGRAAPSITILDGQAVIRCAIVNHRTSLADLDQFITDVETVAKENRVEFVDRRSTEI